MCLGIICNPHSLGFPIGVGGDHIPLNVIRQAFDRQKGHFQHRVVSRTARDLRSRKQTEIVRFNQ